MSKNKKKRSSEEICLEHHYIIDCAILDDNCIALITAKEGNYSPWTKLAPVGYVTYVTYNLSNEKSGAEPWGCTYFKKQF